MSSDARCEVKASGSEEDERHDLEDQTSEHEMVSQLHGRLLRRR